MIRGKKILFGGFVIFAMVLLLPYTSLAGKLMVKTIPQEDQIREKGIMILCPPGTDQLHPIISRRACRLDDPSVTVVDFHTEHKIHFQDPDGKNVDPVEITCTIIEKDVCHIPERKPITGRIEATNLVNISSEFICVYRSDTTGVGILEVYFDGRNDPVFIGDHILKVEAVDAKGNRGAEIQDICIIGFPVPLPFPFSFPVKWPDTERRLIKQIDALFPFGSCKNLALLEREIYANGANRPDLFVQECDPDQQKLP